MSSCGPAHCYVIRMSGYVHLASDRTIANYIYYSQSVLRNIISDSVNQCTPVYNSVHKCVTVYTNVQQCTPGYARACREVSTQGTVAQNEPLNQSGQHIGESRTK